VQVLFGFLLSLPFTNRSDTLSPAQRDLYLASPVLAAVATALLLGPVAYHRLVFRRGQKESLLRAASVMAIAGLAAVGLAVSAAFLAGQRRPAACAAVRRIVADNRAAYPVR
jgi:cation transport ATPase